MAITVTIFADMFNDIARLTDTAIASMTTYSGAVS